MLTRRSKNHLHMRGFTLVELLVSTSIFVLVLSMATSSLVSSQVINTQLQKTQVILDGVNLAAEVMVRDIRYGSEFNCSTVGPVPTILRKGCPYVAGNPVGTVLVFRPAVSLKDSINPRYDRVGYYLQNGAIYRIEYPYGAPSRTTQLTSNDVTINTIGFYSVGVNTMSGSTDVGNQTDVDQPLIVIMMSGVTKPELGKGTPVSFKLHTSAESRIIDR